ncbi:hypothetical protein B296_00007929 [Ensete ventricosum]|uniref:Uncharacterized protein n=1 Tax=Ensete ventricosum TaxID=4639 RepID=A0A427AQ76_ENSVE|nr:hypothetical protein B296_00007929 [Ensete ventricosum]
MSERTHSQRGKLCPWRPTKQDSRPKMSNSPQNVTTDSERLQLNQGPEVDSSTRRSPGFPIYQPTSEELAHPSGANKESSGVHVYAGSTKPR